MSGTAGVALADRIRGMRVLVVGEAMLDSYLAGSTTRLCREAPVPIVQLDGRSDVPGGAANAAANLASLGARPVFASLAGDDHEASLLRAALRGAGVDDRGVLASAGRRTLTRHRVVSGGQIVLRFDQGTSDPIAADEEDALCRLIAREAPGCDAIVVSDYEHGLLTPRVREVIAACRRRAGNVLVIDAKHPERYAPAKPHAVKPSWDVAARVLGAEQSIADRAAVVAERRDELLAALGARAAAVTLDGDGVLLLERDAEPYRIYARRVPSGQTAGAGDTFTVALAAALAAGGTTTAAAELAAAAASVTVARAGTSTCDADELRAVLGGGEKVLPDRAALDRAMARLRADGRRIVLTNGCFDILHRGHVTYLTQAKALGDVLVVGVNDDDGVRRLKGPTRPVNPLDDRLALLAALSCVDFVTSFAEDTPVELAGAVRPDVFTKGGDYTPEQLPERAVVERHGGRVEILPFIADRSTTRVIELAGLTV